MTETESRLMAMNTALCAALTIALGEHPNRKQVIQRLRHVQESLKAFHLASRLDDKSIEVADNLFSSWIKSLENT